MCSSLNVDHSWSQEPTDGLRARNVSGMEDNRLLGELRNMPEVEEGSEPVRSALSEGLAEENRSISTLNMEEDRIPFLYGGDPDIEDKRLKVK